MQGYAWNPRPLTVSLCAAQGTCDAVERVPSKERSVNGTHSLGLMRDELASGCVAHWADALGRSPLPGALNVRARLASTLAFNLSTGNCRLDPCVHSAAIGAEVSVAIGCHEEEATGLSPVDPIFQLPRLACEPVEAVAHDGVEEPRLVVLHHAEIGRVLLRLVACRDGLIDVSLDNLPPTERG